MSEKELREKIAKAEGPSTEIDRMIFAFDFGWTYPLVGAAWEEWLDQGSRYTASIDAAVALIERKLPGFGFEVLAADRDSYRAAVWPWISSRGTRAQIGHQHSYAKTPALALIAALLSALETHNG